MIGALVVSVGPDASCRRVFCHLANVQVITRSVPGGGLVEKLMCVTLYERGSLPQDEGDPGKWSAGYQGVEINEGVREELARSMFPAWIGLHRKQTGACTHKQTSHRGSVLFNERVSGSAVLWRFNGGFVLLLKCDTTQLHVLSISTCSLDSSVRWWYEPADNRMTWTCRPKSTFRFKQNTMRGEGKRNPGRYFYCRCLSLWDISMENLF